MIQEALPAGGYRTIIGHFKPTGPEFGEATLPAHKVLGKYKYRLAMVLKGKVIAQKQVTIGVFDYLPLSVLFADQTSLGTAVYAFPGGQFKYIGAASRNTKSRATPPESSRTTMSSMSLGR
jgi:hypothetical protein